MFSGTAVAFEHHNHALDEEHWDPEKLNDSPCKAQSFESNSGLCPLIFLPTRKIATEYLNSSHTFS